MKKLDETLLLSGNDIPFEQAQLTIHNPTIKEIGFYGEDTFHIGTQFLVFEKNHLSEEEQEALEKYSDFDIFLAIMLSKEKAEHKSAAKKILDLLFPGALIKFMPNQISLQYKDNVTGSIDKQNYGDFKAILNQMFCLDESAREGKGGYNPQGSYAKKIADKLAERQKKLAKQKGQTTQKINIYSQYASILSIGMHINLNEILNYTVYQIRDAMKRYTLKEDFDMYVKAKLAGAQDLDEVENWMGDIHKN